MSSLGDKRIVPIAEPVDRIEFKQFKKRFWQHFYQEVIRQEPNHEEDSFEKLGGSALIGSSKQKKQKGVSQKSTIQADSTLLKQLKQLKNKILQSRAHLAKHSEEKSTFTEKEIAQIQSTLTVLEELKAELEAELSAKQHPRNNRSFSMNA